MIVAIFVLFLIVMGFGIYAEVQEQRRWEAFSINHDCKLIGHMRGDMTTGFGVAANGQMVTTINVTPDKKGYACDDGKQYWR